MRTRSGSRDVNVSGEITKAAGSNSTDLDIIVINRNSTVGFKTGPLGSNGSAYWSACGRHSGGGNTGEIRAGSVSAVGDLNYMCTAGAGRHF